MKFSFLIKLAILSSSLGSSVFKESSGDANIPGAISILDKLKAKLLDIVGDVNLGGIAQLAPHSSQAANKDPLSPQDVVKGESRGLFQSGDNPFVGISPIPVEIPSNPLSGLMDLEAAEAQSISEGRVGVEPICECARNHMMINTKMSGRIIGGSSARPNTMPWQIFIRILKKFRCGGTLLNRKFVLSAMHCFFKIVNLENPGKDVLIGAGIHDLCVDTSKNDYGWQLAYVTRIHHQGNFHEKSFDNDLAILELDRALTLTEKIMPACLPTREYPEGADVYISGWGQVRDDKVPCELQYLELLLHSQETCRSTDIGQRYLFTAAKPYPDIQICAGNLEGGKDACQGDSGGPLVTSGFNDYIEIVGIVSWGIGCGRKNSPGSYTNVFKYIDFINQTISAGECWYKAEQNATLNVLHKALQTVQETIEKVVDNTTSRKDGSSTFGTTTTSSSGSPKVDKNSTIGSTKTSVTTTVSANPVLENKLIEQKMRQLQQQKLKSILEGEGSSFKPSTSTQPQATSACKFSQWIGNGYCDDLVNTAECRFDGGDCCQNKNPKWNQYCKKCACLNS